MVIVALVMGSNVLAALPNDHPDIMFSLRGHISIGIIVGVLMIVRLVTRLRSAQPPKADTGNNFLNFAGGATHWVLYILVFLMVASGIGISIGAGLPEIVFFGSAAPLPDSFDHLVPRTAHGVLSKLLMLTILAHIAGWAYHQFMLKDGLFIRMWFGSRN